jgi:hypothetical protein
VIARRRAGLFLFFLALTNLFSYSAWGCFGTRLRVGVVPVHALACYATGYFVEEKTGIKPEFVDLEDNPAAALAKSQIDLVLAREATPLPAGLVTRPAGNVPGVGPARFWLRPDVLDDLRFFTVERALGRISGFFASSVYRNAHDAKIPPKKAARQAVLRAD